MSRILAHIDRRATDHSGRGIVTLQVLIDVDNSDDEVGDGRTNATVLKCIDKFPLNCSIKATIVQGRGG